jgi:hypothetical protein
METMILEIPPIMLEWSEWYSWDQFKQNQHANVSVPTQPGVYEAKLIREEKRLTIGKSTNLSRRIVAGLIRGNIPHSAGERIRANETTSQILIRWAITEQISLVEAILHTKHIERFGILPIYTRQT